MIKYRYYIETKNGQVYEVYWDEDIDLPLECESFNGVIEQIKWWKDKVGDKCKWPHRKFLSEDRSILVTHAAVRHLWIEEEKNED